MLAVLNWVSLRWSQLRMLHLKFQGLPHLVGEGVVTQPLFHQLAHLLAAQPGQWFLMVRLRGRMKEWR